MKPYRLKPNLLIETILITKDNNINDQNIEGYEVEIQFSNGQKVNFIEYTIDELEDKPYGIYKFDNEFIMLEDWEN